MSYVQTPMDAVTESQTMKSIKPLLIALVLVGAFFLWTTHRQGSFEPKLGGGGKLELTEAASGDQKLDAEEQVNVSVYKKAIPSVVNITSRVNTFNFFYGVMPQEGQGTGFIIDSAGHILTNYHVVQGRQAKLEVTLYNRKKYPAQLVGYDARHDLAVIKITAPELKPATLGDSRSLQVGQKVFAIGNPFGLNGTMTRGIVSSIRSVEEPSGNRIEEAIQTDAAINPGNSGGPLLNSRAEVIGVNTMIASNVGQSAGIGFAIPINTAKAVVNDLVTYGRVRRPALGIASLPISPELAQELGLAADYGLLVMQVVPGGPADRAGIHGGTQQAWLGNTRILIGGDLIVAIDNTQIEDQQDLAHVMNNHRAGDSVKLTFMRGRRKMEATVTLGEASAST